MRITGIAEAGLFAPMRKPTAGGEDFAELFGLAQQQLELPAEEAEDSEANAPDDEWGVELLEQDVTFPEADRHAMLPNEPLDDLLAGLVAFGDPMVSESEAPIVVPRVSQVVERAVPRRPVTTSSTTGASMPTMAFSMSSSRW